MVFDARPPFAAIKSWDTGPITNHVNFAHARAGTFAYVTVGGLNQVQVYRTDGLSRVATTAVGKLPHGVWPSGDDSRIHVGLENADALAAIDTATNTVIGTVPIGQAPQADEQGADREVEFMLTLLEFADRRPKMPCETGCRRKGESATTTPRMSKLPDADGSPIETSPRGAYDDSSARAAALLNQGIVAASRGDAASAIAAFEQAVAWRPDSAIAHANLGLLLMATNRRTDAAPHLRAAVSAMPGDAVLQNALGVALEASNRLTEAAHSYRAALAADPSLAEAHANLGNCLRRLGRPDDAQAHYVQAIALKPDFAVAHYNFGILLQDRAEHERAMAQYRRALACRPDYIEALNNLGSCLRAQGLVDEARATFERILELQPTRIEAHCNLAQYKTYKPGDPQIHTLLAQQHRLASLPQDGQVRYWFTVGKMFEDVGQHDVSFVAYVEGNRAKHAITPWDETAHRDLQRRIVATFTREMMRQATVPESVEGPAPVFILGMPRSGTSLLEQVLSTLPGVHGAGEITLLAETLQSAGNDIEEGAFEFPETLGNWPGERLQRLGRRYIEGIRALAPQATHVVDKLPANFTHIGLIHLMFPTARIVHAMRDPMDSCFSCYSRLFSGGNLGFTYDLGTVGRYWVSYHELMQHWRDVLPPGRILDVSYETMVSDFENEARRVVAYLGLPWDDRALGFHDSQRVVKTASVAQVRRPIYRTSVARWKPYERHLGQLYELVKAFR